MNFKAVKYIIKKNFCHPVLLCRNWWLNFCRKNTCQEGKSALLLEPYSVVDAHESAQIHVIGRPVFGYNKYKGSRLETSLWMDENAIFEINNTHIYHGCDIQIFRGGKLSMAANVMNRGAQIICQEEITIGEGCLISRDVIIRDNEGGHSIKTDGYKNTAPVHIEDNVWIGQGAMIMKGVTIGEGSVIGAGAIVMTNVKPHSLVMPDASRTFMKDIIWEA